ncbi:MAG TPA: electron transfer flavoprotein subunit alpha/FixB family protein, partial [Candidatus Limnocylindrales bacterium]
MSERRSIWVHVEQVDGRIADVSLELVGKARELADPLGYEVVGLLCGHGVEALAWDVIRHGADRVLLADHPELAQYRTLPYARVAITEARRRRPEIFLVGGTSNGRDLAPRVASALRCGLTADCTDLQVGDYHVKREGRTYENLLYQIRPAFGGNLVATIVNPTTRPQMATVREGVMRMPAADATRTGVVEPVTPDFEPADFALEVLSREVRPSTVRLKDAPVVVSGGAGISDADEFALL